MQDSKIQKSDNFKPSQELPQELPQENVKVKEVEDEKVEDEKVEENKNLQKVSPKKNQKPVADKKYRICFITSLIGDSSKEVDKPSKFLKLKQYDYFLFTNLPENMIRSSWNVINISDVLDKSGITSNVIKSRYAKFMGWHYIKNVLKKKYDAIFYCDGLYNPIVTKPWQKFAKIIEENESGIIQQPHIRNAYKECDAIVKFNKDSTENAKNLKVFLEEHNLPTTHEMMENTAFGYDPNNTKITNAFQEFWDIYTTYGICHRDQPLWSYVSWKHNIKPHKMVLTKILNHHKVFERKGKKGFNGHSYAKNNWKNKK